MSKSINREKKNNIAVFSKINVRMIQVAFKLGVG